MQKRTSGRHEVTIMGQYRSGSGIKRDVTMLDLSDSGCRFHDRRTILRVDSALTLRIEALGPFDATVRWIDGDLIGVRFEALLYGPIFEHIRDTLDNSDWRPPSER